MNHPVDIMAISINNTCYKTNTTTLSIECYPVIFLSPIVTICHIQAVMFTDCHDYDNHDEKLINFHPTDFL